MARVKALSEKHASQILHLRPRSESQGPVAPPRGPVSSISTPRGPVSHIATPRGTVSHIATPRGTVIPTATPSGMMKSVMQYREYSSSSMCENMSLRN
ncbi:hypothetical protein AOLI_G00037820 [Acnodon oligacanthus]